MKHLGNNIYQYNEDEIKENKRIEKENKVWREYKNAFPADLNTPTTISLMETCLLLLKRIETLETK